MYTPHSKITTHQGQSQFSSTAIHAESNLTNHLLTRRQSESTKDNLNHEPQTAIFDRETQVTDTLDTVVNLKAIKETMIATYSRVGIISIQNFRNLECFFQLVKIKVISLANISEIEILPFSELNSYSSPIACMEQIAPENIKLVDTMLTFLKKNKFSFANFNKLRILSPYSGSLIIPCLWFSSHLNLQPTILEVAIVFGDLIIHSQSNLAKIIIGEVKNNLSIFEGSIKSLTITDLWKSNISIQSKLESLYIKYCHCNLSLERQPNLKRIDIRHMGNCLVTINSEQKTTLISKLDSSDIAIVDK